MLQNVKEVQSRVLLDVCTRTVLKDLTAVLLQSFFVRLSFLLHWVSEGSFLSQFSDTCDREKGLDLHPHARDHFVAV